MLGQDLVPPRLIHPIELPLKLLKVFLLIISLLLPVLDGIILRAVCVGLSQCIPQTRIFDSELVSLTGSLIALMLPLLMVSTLNHIISDIIKVEYLLL